jgi:DNA-binding FadR family transcriptional regulator
MDNQAGQRAHAFTTIRGRITSGEYAALSAIQSQSELALQLGVTRDIVRIAVAHLCKLGYLAKSTRQGTHVRPAEFWQEPATPDGKQ